MAGNEDFSGAYLNPGLLVEEVQGPVLSAVGIAPTVLGIVGDSQRHRRYTEIVQLTGTADVALSKLGIDSSSVRVQDRFTGTTHTITTDYVLTVGTGADAISSTLDDTLAIHRTTTGAIPGGAFVTVSYTYTDPDFYALHRYTDYDDIRDFYGDPFTSAGVINSEVTLGALLAFKNGAREIYVAAVQAAGATPDTGEWTSTINLLRDEPRINLVVPMSGDSTVHGLVKSHVDTMANQSQYRRGFVGYAAGTAATTIKTAAAAYASTRMVVVGPSSFEFFEGNTGNMITLGGQHLAAVVAGRHSGEAANVPLTHKRLQVVAKIPSQPTEASMVDYQRAGVTWIYQRRTNEVIVRHGLTTDNSNMYTRELSVQAAKDRLMQLCLDTLEAQNLIGSVMTDDTPGYVVGAVMTALEGAAADRLIHSYRNVKYRQPISNPTVVQIRFEYKPSLPLNSIQVQFAIDTNTGSTDFTEVA